jgi:1,2-diacylglycerol 3-alpha-glucosyltransferase
MNILMMTNTYKPIVGGIEKSIEVFSSQYREKGHNVLIIAPVFKDAPPHEPGVFRIPAIQNFNGSDFSVELPAPGILNQILDKFNPDIVHSHHPFLVGDTALRVSADYNIPIVFTYHTRYEMNTHYVPGDSDLLKSFVVNLALGYSNLCNKVIAPSQSIEKMLRERGVKTQIETIPTGIDVVEFQPGDGKSLRKSLNIPDKAFVAGYLGRLAEEKNMLFLTEAVSVFLEKNKDAHFLIVGKGDLEKKLRESVEKRSLKQRVHFTGILKGAEKISAYHAMDVFVFASKSETQGLVLAEAMAAGVPAIGLDSPGVRDIIKDDINGYLLHDDDIAKYKDAIQRFSDLDENKRDSLSKHARATANDFDYGKSIKKTLAVYEQTIGEKAASGNKGKHILSDIKRSIKQEIGIIANLVKSAKTALETKGIQDEDEK